jgi:molybdopterin-binding protein
MTAPHLCPRPHHRNRRASSTGGKIMKISARNVLKGKIVEVNKGQTTAHVRIDIGGGKIVTSSITNEAVEELKLKAGQEASAVIKASDVMVAID